ncbi:MAG: hypothetical protein AAB628_03380 [Patescibacteria group bacterium]
MKNILKNIKHLAKKTRLADSEKASIRQELIRYAEAHPASYVPHAKSPFSFHMRSKRVLSGTVLLGILLGGSLSFAAETALPGNILYPIKVNINEPARGALLVSEQEKADWDMRLVERRLAEIAKLSASENTSPEVQQLAEERLAQYTDRVKKHIDKFDEQHDSEHANVTLGKFDDALRTHEQTLQRMNIEKDDAQTRKATQADSLNASTTVSRMDKNLDHQERKLKNLKKEYEYVENKKRELREEGRSELEGSNKLKARDLEKKTEIGNENNDRTSPPPVHAQEELKALRDESLRTSTKTPDDISHE